MKKLRFGTKRYYITGAILLLFVVLSVLYMQIPNIYKSQYYCFSYSPKISIATKEFSDYIETDFYIDEKLIGGVDYYPFSNWNDFYQRSSSNSCDADVGSFLKKQGILQTNESLDEYMLDIGINDRSATLWEKRSDIERDHFFVFTETGHCYDLWFYCNGLDSSEKEDVIESFRLEVLI